MAPKGKAKAKSKTKARALRQRQLGAANARQKRRREALAELNAMANDVGFAAAPLVLTPPDHAAVEQRVRALQRRCPDAVMSRT